MHRTQWNHIGKRFYSLLPHFGLLTLFYLSLCLLVYWITRNLCLSRLFYGTQSVSTQTTMSTPSWIKPWQQRIIFWKTHSLEVIITWVIACIVYPHIVKKLTIFHVQTTDIRVVNSSDTYALFLNVWLA